MSLKGGPVTGISREQLPITTVLMNGGSTPATALPLGASIYRIEFPATSVPTIFSLKEAQSTAGTFFNMRKSGGTNSTVSLSGGTSTSAGGVVFVPDMACAKFIKIVSSHTLATAPTYTFRLFAWG